VPVKLAPQLLEKAAAHAEAKRIKPDAGLWTALEEMDRGGVSQLAVMSDGHLLGMLRKDDAIRFLRTLQAVHT
jgi:CBS domain-containing protein